MLTPDYLAELGDALTGLYEEYQTSLINDMARRIAKLGVTDASTWQLTLYQEAGGVYEDAMYRLAQLTGRSQYELRELFEQAGTQVVTYDSTVYTAAGITPIPLAQSPIMLQILVAGLQKTQGQLDNWTMTTAVTAQQSYINAVNTAYMQVVSGGMSYQQAIADAIKQAARDGLHVLYPSGHRDRIDVAVRRAVMTGISQTAGQMSLQNIKDMGTDFAETSAHMGARPSHAAWQGRVYQISNGDFVSITGYGTGQGLCGWNCRHSFHAFFPGISQRMYTDEALQEMADATVIYDGEEMTLYDATQKQRAMEREIRSLKREWSALQAAEAADMGAVSYKNAYEEVALKLQKQRRTLRAFETETGLPSQSARAQVLGFGRSEASTATWAARRVAQRTEMSYTEAANAFRASIFSGEQPLNVLQTLQSKHLVDTAPVGRSYIIGEIEDAQNLITRYAGTGVFDRDGKGRFVQKEIIHTDMPIGMVWEDDGYYGTSSYKIHYRKTGAHVVPRKEPNR